MASWPLIFYNPCTCGFEQHIWLQLSESDAAFLRNPLRHHEGWVQAELVARLSGALQAAEALAAEEKVVSKDDAFANMAEAAARSEGLPALAPGTQHVGKMVSAKVLHPLNSLALPLPRSSPLGIKSLPDWQSLPHSGLAALCSLSAQMQPKQPHTETNTCNIACKCWAAQLGAVPRCWDAA